MIKIICYNQVETWHKRANAKRFYYEAVLACEGSERDRYATILDYLEANCNICCDDYVSEEEAKVLAERLSKYITKAPDGTRDYGNKIWFK